MAASIGPAAAQLAPDARVHLDLTVEQAQFIVAIIPQMQCNTVQQLALCQQALELLAEMKKQLREQLK